MFFFQVFVVEETPFFQVFAAGVFEFLLCKLRKIDDSFLVIIKSLVLVLPT
jgi:hypothetical protein